MNIVECKNLIDEEGNPILLDLDNISTDKEELKKFRTSAWECGVRFRMGLDEMNKEDNKN